MGVSWPGPAPGFLPRGRREVPECRSGLPQMQSCHGGRWTRALASFLLDFLLLASTVQRCRGASPRPLPRPVPRSHHAPPGGTALGAGSCIFWRWHGVGRRQNSRGDSSFRGAKGQLGSAPQSPFTGSGIERGAEKGVASARPHIPAEATTPPPAQGPADPCPPTSRMGQTPGLGCPGRQSCRPSPQPTPPAHHS